MIEDRMQETLDRCIKDMKRVADLKDGVLKIMVAEGNDEIKRHLKGAYAGLVLAESVLQEKVLEGKHYLYGDDDN